MKIKSLITKLNRYYKKYGNLDLYVDTDAANFMCHMVKTENIYFDKLSDDDKYLYLTVDDGVKCIIPDKSFNKIKKDCIYFRSRSRRSNSPSRKILSPKKSLKGNIPIKDIKRVVSKYSNG